jgi:hypothetical protein
MIVSFHISCEEAMEIMPGLSLSQAIPSIISIDEGVVVFCNNDMSIKASKVF